MRHGYHQSIRTIEIGVKGRTHFECKMWLEANGFEGYHEEVLMGRKFQSRSEGRLAGSYPRRSEGIEYWYFEPEHRDMAILFKLRFGGA